MKSRMDEMIDEIIEEEDKRWLADVEKVLGEPRDDFREALRKLSEKPLVPDKILMTEACLKDLLEVMRS